MKNALFTVALVVSLSLAQAQLVMVRCDDGHKQLLESPTDIDLSAIQQSFDPQLDTVVMIHGFMTSYDRAQSAYESSIAELEKHLGEANYIGFHWPSDVLWFGTAIETANRTGPYVMHVIGEVMRWYGNSECRIHLISHSLGGRVLLDTLEENSARFVNWGGCFKMASGVHCVAYQDEFSDTNLVPENTVVYYSENDWVLKYLYALYYLLFPNGLVEFPEEWQRLSAEEKIEYLHALEQSVERGQQLDSKFDAFAYEQIQRAEKDAMGLVGAVLDGPKKVLNVINVDVSSVVSGHSYWGNARVMELIAGEIGK